MGENVIRFTVEDEPKSQKRHRHVSRGKFTSVYDPSKADKRDFMLKAMEFAPAEPFDTETSVELVFGFQRPRYHWGTGKNARKLKPSAPKSHLKKPDVDNLQKFVFDALNGVFWSDDSIINNVKATKLWSAGSGFVSVNILNQEGD